MTNINPYLFHYNTDINGNLQTVKIDNEKSQASPLHFAIQMSQIPKKGQGIVVLNDKNEELYEVNKRNKISSNSYWVDYNNGIIYLDSINAGKVFTYSFHGIGWEFISCSRIVDFKNVNGQTIRETLQEIIDKGRECIDALNTIGNAIELLKRIENYIIVATELDIKLKEDIKIGDQLHIDLTNDISTGLTLHKNLTNDITVGDKLHNNLTNDISTGTTLDTNLKASITEGNTTKSELDKSRLEAQDDIATIKATGNGTWTIPSSAWVGAEPNLTYTINHKMNSKDLIVAVIDTTSQKSVMADYRIVDMNNIEMQSMEATNITVTINAKYYSGKDANIIAQEVIDARGVEVDLKSRLDKNDAQFDDIKNDVINVKYHPLYNVNNISLALNDIISKLKEGDKVVLSCNTAKIITPITGYIPPNVTLDLDCKFEVVGNIDGFNLKGSQSPIFIYIKGIYGDKINYLTNTNSGLKLTASFSSSIELGNIVGFFKGLNLCCEHDGIQYMRLKYQNILSCKYGIVLDAKTFWINENTFECGMLGCNVGIKSFEPIGTTSSYSSTNIDCYNNNRFIHPAFEYITEKCVDVTNFYHNSITDFRLMEEYPTTGIIFNEVKSYANHYKCTHKIKSSQFKIDFESTIEGMICDDNMVYLSDKAWSRYQALTNSNKNAFEQFSQTVYVSSSLSDTLQDRTFNYTKAFDTVYMGVGYDHKFIRIPQIYNYEGFQLNVYWESEDGQTNGGLGLKVIDGDNSTQHWLTKGLTKVMYINGNWKFIKIKDVS